MRAVVCGANGAMGQLIREILAEEAVGLVSLDGENGVPKTFAELPPVEPEVVVDFSHHSAIASVLAYAQEQGCAVVVGTTGHTEAEKAMIDQAAQTLPIFYSGNMSLGIAVLCRLACQAAALFPEADIEIMEIHHNRKVDAPSGTAHMLFQSIQKVRPQAVEHCGRAGEGRRAPGEIGISSVRMGNVVGIHEVHICTGSQTLTLRHEASSRKMLADGAVTAARYVIGKPAGLYNMETMLEER